MLLSAEHIRIVLATALFIAVVFAPWWVVLAVALVLSVRFRAWEVLVAGVLYDLLWLPVHVGVSLDALPYASMIALILVLALEPLRRQLLVGPAIL